MRIICNVNPDDWLDIVSLPDGDTGAIELRRDNQEWHNIILSSETALKLAEKLIKAARKWKDA